MNKLALVASGFLVSSIVTLASRGEAAPSLRWRRINASACHGERRFEEDPRPVLHIGRFYNGAHAQNSVTCPFPEDNTFKRGEVQTLAVYGEDTSSTHAFSATACVREYNNDGFHCGPSARTTASFQGESTLMVNTSAWRATQLGTAMIEVAITPDGGYFNGIFAGDGT